MHLIFCAFVLLIHTQLKQQARTGAKELTLYVCLSVRHFCEMMSRSANLQLFGLDHQAEFKLATSR